mgnify:CR=1 FL=1
MELRTLILAILFTSGVVVAAPPRSPTRQSPAAARTKLLKVLRVKESRGINNAVGDRGKSKGPLQIQRPYWTEACRYAGVGGLRSWTYDKAVWDWQRSQRVVQWYWQKNCPTAYRTGNLEVLARTHNGGPNGPRRTATLKYWTSVKLMLGIR